MFREDNAGQIADIVVEIAQSITSNVAD